MDAKQFNDIIKLVANSHGLIDVEKLKLLPDNLKGKMITFLINSNRKIIKELVVKPEQEIKVKRKGYTIEENINGRTYLSTYFQSIQPK